MASGSDDVATYIRVYLALLVLTAVTVWVGTLNLGNMAIVGALVVALVKGWLVASEFMHLRQERGYVLTLFMGSLAMLAVLFLLTAADVTTRGKLHPEEGNHVLRDARALPAD